MNSSVSTFVFFYLLKWVVTMEIGGQSEKVQYHIISSVRHILYIGINSITLQ